MSELKRVIEQCDACGRFRYPNDLIAYDCHVCGEWAEKQIIALRADVARSQNFASGLQRELTETIDKWNAEVAALKAELAKHTEPLTYEQAEKVCDDTSLHILTEGEVDDIDAAIRRVRRGE